jgi:nitrate reductase molybdenum cofactor assembly chaperone NarJ/NarW
MVGSQTSAGLDSYLAEALTGTRRFFTRAEVSLDSRAPESTDPLAWQAQSLLLGFPDAEMVGQLDLLRLVAIALDDPVGGPLGRFIDHVARTPAARLAADYVATFDHPDCCLFLTYGTPNRDTDVLRLEETYTGNGLRLTGNELPDHLGVMLEYAAAEPRTGAALLIEHRAALQMLRLGLRDTHSPWADVLDSVWATLPPMVGDEWLAVAHLAALRPSHEPIGVGAAGPSGIPRQRAAQSWDVRG